MFWTHNDFHSLKSKVDTMSVDGNWVSPWVNVSVVCSWAPWVWQRDRWLLAIHLHYQRFHFFKNEKKNQLIWKKPLYSSTIWFLLHTHFTSSNIKMTALLYIKISCLLSKVHQFGKYRWDGICSRNKSQIL